MSDDEDYGGSGSHSQRNVGYEQQADDGGGNHDVESEQDHDQWANSDHYPNQDEGDEDQHQSDEFDDRETQDQDGNSSRDEGYRGQRYRGEEPEPEEGEVAEHEDSNDQNDEHQSEDADQHEDNNDQNDEHQNADTDQHEENDNNQRSDNEEQQEQEEEVELGPASDLDYYENLAEEEAANVTDEDVNDYISELFNNSEEFSALYGEDGNSNIAEIYPEFKDVPAEDAYVQMVLQPQAFSGLVGNSTGDFLKGQDDETIVNRHADRSHFSFSNFGKSSGGGGNEGGSFGKLDVAKMLFKMGKTVLSHSNQSSATGGKGIFGKIFKSVLSGGHGGGDAAQHGGGGGFGGIGDILKGLAEGKGIGTVISGLVAGSGGFGNRGTAGNDAGGGNISTNSLNGGLLGNLGNVIGEGLHKYFGVDPKTGKILGSIAGNLIFHFGGKDNKLGNIGKVVLDNIVSGKSKRKVEPYVSPSAGHKSQDFVSLRDECLRNKQLFEDTLFPASDQSIYYSQRPSKNVEWLRPGEICKDPQLFVEGHSRFDVVQGELGDCWLLAAVSNLTLRDELFYRVVPPDQSFVENYAGIFHFQFWQYGKWVDVVIDDRLPCYQGKLLYMHSSSCNEFWSALLEKAYAKFYGSYEALKGGNTCEALEDFTGGLTEYIDLKDQPSNLMQMMFKAFECGSLLGCSIEADPSVQEAKLSNGLVRGHAYSITGMKMVETHNGQIPLLRIRNPWGNKQEWNGRWSDNSREWDSVSDSERQQIGLTFAHDGEFWMCYEDFVATFEKLEMCHLGPDVMNDIEDMTGTKPKHQQWQMQTFDGEWVAGQTAGGCRNFIKTFTNNPQYGVNFTHPEPGDKDGLSVGIMAVLQKFRRERRKEGVDLLPIGFAVYESHDSKTRLTTESVSQQKAVARSPMFINLREIIGRFRFNPGSYVMVPSTFEPDKEASFMVRMFSYPNLDAASLS